MTISLLKHQSQKWKGHNTDYILVKADVAVSAEQVWINAGFPVKAA